MTAEPTLKPGTTIGSGYQILDAIGSGMSGTVYRARKGNAGREVALKLMHTERATSPLEQERFRVEAQMVMKLQHPNVVPLLDCGHSDDGIPYLVFALLRGQSLEAKLRQSGALDAEATGRFSVQVLRALEKAHGLGIVHRDMKPGNIFLSAGVVGEVAQVIDFGLAKMVGEGDKVDVMQEGTIMGTPRYMAPEQVRGERVGHEADIYAFGLVMAEMITGTPLISGDEFETLVAQGSDRPVELPDEVLSSPFGAVIRRAVAKEVAVRYHLASQMLTDVRATIVRMAEEAVEDDYDDEDNMQPTAMIDPEMAAKLFSSVDSERMRMALNLAADKAEDRRGAAEAAAESPAIEVSAYDEMDEDDLDLDDVDSDDAPPSRDAPPSDQSERSVAVESKVMARSSSDSSRADWKLWLLIVLVLIAAIVAALSLLAGGE